ncbi:MAG TPA: fimbrial biogenesis outer membrane usher protein, partial [Rhizobiales bacterium]|nr:fimbrial biogenesis outer membrane usher protein [Hyphomicrobiales bacterium]
DGRLLVTGLRSYEKNRIAIDPKNLPVNASVPETSKIAVPAGRSGVLVKFGVERQTSSAIVTVTDSNGKPLKAGTTGKLNSGGADLVVGYDGRVYAEKLSGSNTMTFELENGTCQVSFDYKSGTDAQVEIGPLACR